MTFFKQEVSLSFVLAMIGVRLKMLEICAFVLMYISMYSLGL